ncbi:MAG TPA: CPBP family intramembrane glutamic endopeptidase [Chitinophagaceae bacterium]
MLQVLVKAFRLKAASLFILVYFVSAFVKASFSGRGYTEPFFSFVLFFCGFGGLIYLVTAKVQRNFISIRAPRQEAASVVLYFLGWLALYMILWRSVFSNAYLSNILGFWGLLVVVPFAYLRKTGYRPEDLGLTRKGLGSQVTVAVLAALIIGAVLVVLTPGGRYITSGALSAPGLFQALLAGFGLALLLAGFFEEFFFRAVLQTRLSAYFGSHFTGIVTASLLFSLYHLPFQFFGSGPAAGNFSYALANVFSEALVTAPILGILWARTQNLVAPVLVHSLIDAINGVPRMAAMFNLQ